MEKRDYLMREIEKLTQLLKKLISKIEDINSANFKSEIQQINTELIDQFGFNLNDISEMTNIEFLNKIETIDEKNIELYIELLSEISKKINFFKKEKEYNSCELAKKAILLIDHVDNTSKTFSFERVTLKDELQQQIQ